MVKLLEDAARRAERYVDSLGERRVAPAPRDVVGLERLTGTLPDAGLDPSRVLAELDEFGSPAAVASAGGRYFGFVIGSALPAALAANWLAGAWNQNTGLEAMGPGAARLETTALRWCRELLGLPETARGAFVSGDTMANFTGLAAARHAVLAQHGWDVERDGLFGAPPLRVVVGDEVHISVLKALQLLGLGRARVERVPADAQGRLRPEALPTLDGPTIVCLQAGNVNTGAFDPAEEAIRRAHEAAAWVHVDGAFGLWASAAPGRRHLVAGYGEADSWAVDGHKWLSVPYDSGIAFVRDPKHLRAAMASAAVAYLPTTGEGEAMEFVPEMSRRARGVDAWAALRSLGRTGMADLVERCCRHATRFAERLASGGATVLNEVVLNQVMVSFGSDEATRRTIAEVQRDGTCWCGGTEWHGRAAMRISVSSWATTEADVDRSAAAILRAAAGT